MKLLIVVLLLVNGAWAQSNQSSTPVTPSGADTSPQHHAEVMQHGGQAMGFDQHKTAHHFLVNNDGGRIVVEANSPADNESIAQIRMHLRHIASAFAQGDFSLPMLTHGKMPA